MIPAVVAVSWGETYVSYAERIQKMAFFSQTYGNGSAEAVELSRVGRIFSMDGAEFASEV